MFLSHTSTFPFSLFNSLTFVQKKIYLSHGCSSTSPLYLPLSLSPPELTNLFISSINYLTFLSISFSLSPLKPPNLFISSINYLTFSSTSLPLNSLTSSSPQLIALSISYLNFILGFFFLVSVWFIWFYCYLSLKCVFFPLLFLISFARFYTFIYFFTWFFVLLNFFFFFWLLVFFVFLVFF